ncbi:MAG: AbrB family transcriptional regulator [Gammaproteobacteria bacterium]|nr:AbrB family transcriptional regulator [Gammaproteobacteria bacterium]
MIQSTLTAKAQTTLPKAVRDALGVGPGDCLRYIVSDDDVRILAVRPVERLFGVIKYDGPPVSLDEMDRAIAEGATRE